MKKIIAVITVIFLALMLASCIQTDDNIENYANDVKEYKADAFMPDLKKIGEYKDIKYFCKKDESIFPAYFMKLVVKYETVDFLKEKERLKTAYTYLKNPQKADWDNNYYTIPIEEFSSFGFNFKIAQFNDTVYPKNFGMVGVSEESCEIAYLWVYSPDQDYICETNANEIKEMNEFIEYHFEMDSTSNKSEGNGGVDEMDLLKYLKDNITTDNTIDEIINVFEEMCKTPIEEDLLLNEYGVYDWTGEDMFYYDLVRQYPDGEDEYYQLRVSIMFSPDEENRYLEDTLWSDDTDENFFDYIRKSEGYHYAKDHKLKFIDIRIDQT